jgi:hypothetical protein
LSVTCGKNQSHGKISERNLSRRVARRIRVCPYLSTLSAFVYLSTYRQIFNHRLIPLMYGRTQACRYIEGVEYQSGLAVQVYSLARKNS